MGYFKVFSFFGVYPYNGSIWNSSSDIPNLQLVCRDKEQAFSRLHIYFLVKTIAKVNAAKTQSEI